MALAGKSRTGEVHVISADEPMALVVVMLDIHLAGAPQDVVVWVEA